jgi:hypothetical protein
MKIAAETPVTAEITAAQSVMEANSSNSRILRISHRIKNCVQHRILILKTFEKHTPKLTNKKERKRKRRALCGF